MKFSTAFERVRKGAGMRLPEWSENIVIRAEVPQEGEEKKESYLYYDNSVNVFRWSATDSELFSEEWQTVE